MPTLNKSQLINVVAHNENLPKSTVERVLNAALEQIGGEVKGGGSVELHGFGKFEGTYREARTGRNPSTGAPVEIAAAKGIKFKPAKGLKDLVNA